MPIDITDLRPTVVPKSDQLNAEQLLSGEMTLKLTEVRIGGDDQPVVLHYENDQGRPYKPCKTMRKVLIFAWGADGSQWSGRSMTVYNDPSVKFGGEAVGGIRIRALSDIPKPLKVSLTATKGKKALHEIEVLKPEPVRQAMDPSRLQEWLDSIAAAAADELKALTEQAMKAAKDIGDSDAHRKLRAAGVARNDALKATA